MTDFSVRVYFIGKYEVAENSSWWHIYHLQVSAWCIRLVFHPASVRNRHWMQWRTVGKGYCFYATQLYGKRNIAQMVTVDKGTPADVLEVCTYEGHFLKVMAVGKGAWTNVLDALLYLYFSHLQTFLYPWCYVAVIVVFFHIHGFALLVGVQYGESDAVKSPFCIYTATALHFVVIYTLSKSLWQT